MLHSRLHGGKLVPGQHIHLPAVCARCSLQWNQGLPCASAPTWSCLAGGRCRKAAKQAQRKVCQPHSGCHQACHHCIPCLSASSLQLPPPGMHALPSPATTPHACCCPQAGSCWCTLTCGAVPILLHPAVAKVVLAPPALEPVGLLVHAPGLALQAQPPLSAQISTKECDPRKVCAGTPVSAKGQSSGSQPTGTLINTERRSEQSVTAGPTRCAPRQHLPVLCVG